ncbi:hypothetical protein AYO20_01475 [Fonsecaea nubica]|uniref:Uncharacterized protein n=1 Tax=Fonsecaea nubica TaxID=856822 RepID=A0A178DBX0_9EURO|nr:hypothetical protein AYO20_01475 [Fonsecaea nubica]OAL39157.1 hypothetical protein AYO20_01475 [Fonsecaea nubica]
MVFQESTTGPLVEQAGGSGPSIEGSEATGQNRHGADPAHNAAENDLDQGRKVTAVGSQDTDTVPDISDLEKMLGLAEDGKRDEVKEYQEWFSKTAPSWDNQNILHAAARSGNLSLMRDLLKNEHVKKLVTKADNIGFLPLHDAVAKGSPKMVEILLKSGPKTQVGQRTKRSGYTPVIMAADRGFVEILKSFEGYEKDLVAKSWDGETPLLRAIRRLSEMRASQPPATSSPATSPPATSPPTTPPPTTPPPTTPPPAIAPPAIAPPAISAAWKQALDALDALNSSREV